MASAQIRRPHRRMRPPVTSFSAQEISARSMGCFERQLVHRVFFDRGRRSRLQRVCFFRHGCLHGDVDITPAGGESFAADGAQADTSGGDARVGACQPTAPLWRHCPDGGDRGRRALRRYAGDVPHADVSASPHSTGRASDVGDGARRPFARLVPRSAATGRKPRSRGRSIQPIKGVPITSLGVVAAHEASELWGAERKNYFLLAARYLAVARERGFNQATGATGTVLLGESLYFAGRVKASRPVLEQAIELAPDEATMIHRLLSDAYRRKPKPDLEQALAHNRKYLEDPGLTAEDRHVGQLQQANLLWQMKIMLPARRCSTRFRPMPSCVPKSICYAGVWRCEGLVICRRQFGTARPTPQREEIQHQYQEAIKFFARHKTIR